MDCGSLADVLKKTNHIPEPELKKITHDVRDFFLWVSVSCNQMLFFRYYQVCYIYIWNVG